MQETNTQQFLQNTTEITVFKKKKKLRSFILLVDLGVCRFFMGLVLLLRFPDILKRNFKSASLASCRETNFISCREILPNLKGYLSETR